MSAWRVDAEGSGGCRGGSGGEIALQFFTGYLIEKSLSVDNIFVFVLLFTYSSVPPLMRGAMIAAGRRRSESSTASSTASEPS